MAAKINEALNERPNFIYDMNRGFVQIINNIESHSGATMRFEKRNGSDEDEKSLIDFFKQMEWNDIGVKRNLTVEPNEGDH